MKRSTTPVAVWIGIGVFMLLVQVILGGVTRLTGSGLSITEWNVITGAIPPFSNADWIKEFEKYRQTPQFNLLNVDFTLSDFKFIFFWEWLHRFWARLIGIVFIVGFIYLVVRRYISKQMVLPLLTLFFLGALQGAVGWIMVASGLIGDAVYVKPTRLALHFIFAIGLIAYAFWFFLVLTIRRKEMVVSPKIKNFLAVLIGLTTLQLIFGALMAGHKAATAAPTWPDINGSFLPSTLLSHIPALVNFVDNKITIHFVHRNLAYLIFALTIILTAKLYRYPSGKIFRSIRIAPLILVILQVLLGIFTLISSTGIEPNQWATFEWMAQLHQVAGLLFTLSLVALLYIVRRTA